MAGGALEIAAVMIFAAQLVATFGRCGAAADPPLAFIMAALAWFVASGLVSVWHTWNTMTAGGWGLVFETPVLPGTIPCRRDRGSRLRDPMAAKVVPTLNGIDPRGLSSLWGPLLVVNLGCALRVALQTLTDWTAWAFPLIGVRGTLEVAGLAWWGAGLARLIRQGMAPGASGPPAD